MNKTQISGKGPGGVEFGISFDADPPLSSREIKGIELMITGFLIVIRNIVNNRWNPERVGSSVSRELSGLNSAIGNQADLSEMTVVLGIAASNPSPKKSRRGKA